MGLLNMINMDGDSLFFKYLLQSMCDPSKSHIKAYLGILYYINIENRTDKYTATIGINSNHGYNYKTETVEELFQWDLCVVMPDVEELFVVVGSLMIELIAIKLIHS